MFCMHLLLVHILHQCLNFHLLSLSLHLRTFLPKMMKNKYVAGNWIQVLEHTNNVSYITHRKLLTFDSGFGTAKASLLGTGAMVERLLGFVIALLPLTL